MSRRITPQGSKPPPSHKLRLQVVEPTSCTIEIEAKSTIFELRQKLFARLVFDSEDLPCPLQQSIVDMAEKLHIAFSVTDKVTSYSTIEDENALGTDKVTSYSTVEDVGLCEASRIRVHGVGDDMKHQIASEVDVHLAARSGHSSLLRVVANFCPIRLSEKNNQYSATPLHYSAQHGHPEAVYLIVEANANINPTDAFFQTPLHRAANQGQTDAVAMLLKMGADIDAKDEDGFTPMRLARRFKHAPVMAILAPADGKDIWTAPSPEVQIIRIKPID